MNRYLKKASYYVQRFDEPIEPYEQPLAPGRDAVLAMIKIDEWLAKNENKNR